MKYVTDDLRITGMEEVIAPDRLLTDLPIPNESSALIFATRQAISDILHQRDDRLLVIIGPCSIHDPAAASEYADRLAEAARKHAEDLLVVMRVYFEKPRTTVGWKGLINDPHLDDSFRIEEGLHTARRLLLDLSELGLPLATEALDPITPQYMQDLISWSAIGARTTESQTHREMASGLSCAVGFKNGTDGGLDVAINALQSTSRPHRFLGISPSGEVAIIHTRGNALGHIVLRGGSAGPNYDADSVAACEAALDDAGLPRNLMVDCSHANSSKDPARQPIVLDDVLKQIEAGNRSIVGAMIESHIGFGNQSLAGGRETLAYGVSVTDGCIDWETTAECLRDAAARLRPLLAERTGAAEDWARRAG